MVKHVFPNRQVAHVWAAQTQDEGRSGNGQFYFQGATLYSYRIAWPIAVITQITTPAGKRVVVVNDETYSVTTSHHRSMAYGALQGHERYEVITADKCATVRLFDRNQWFTPEREGQAKTVLLNERIAHLKKCAEACAKPHVNFNPYRWCEQWEGHLDECDYRIRVLYRKQGTIVALAEMLGVQSSDIPAFDMEALVRRVREAFASYNDPKRVKAREASKRRRKLKLISEVYTKGPHASDSALWEAYELACQYRKDIAPIIGRDIQARLYDRELKAKLHTLYPEADHVLYERRYGRGRRVITPQEWMDGANGLLDETRWRVPTLVRRVGDRVETSRGAEVPFKAAVGLYQMAAKARSSGLGYPLSDLSLVRERGPIPRVGAFEVRSIDAEGNCTVGCHHLQFSEMERLAIREVPHLVKARFPLPAIVQGKAS